MSKILTLSAVFALMVLNACSQQEEPEPAPPMLEPEPVFTGKP
jgi:hypothetical protein